MIVSAIYPTITSIIQNVIYNETAYLTHLQRTSQVFVRLQVGVAWRRWWSWCRVGEAGDLRPLRLEASRQCYSTWGNNIHKNYCLLNSETLVENKQDQNFSESLQKAVFICNLFINIYPLQLWILIYISKYSDKEEQGRGGQQSQITPPGDVAPTLHGTRGHNTHKNYLLKTSAKRVETSA